MDQSPYNSHAPAAGRALGVVLGTKAITFASLPAAAAADGSLGDGSRCIGIFFRNVSQGTGIEQEPAYSDPLE